MLGKVYGQEVYLLNSPETAGAGNVKGFSTDAHRALISPALLSSDTGMQISAAYHNLYGAGLLNTARISVSKPLSENLFWGANISYFGTSEVRDYLANAAAAYKIGVWSYGISLGVRQYSAETIRPEKQVVSHFSAAYQPRKYLRAYSGYRIAPQNKMAFQKLHEWYIGTCYQAIEDLSIGLEISNLRQINFGSYFELNDNLNFSFGLIYADQRASPTIGLALAYKDIAINISLCSRQLAGVQQFYGINLQR